MSDHSRDQLVSFVQRYKSIEDQILDLRGDIKDIRAEAKAAGFDPVKIGEVVRWLLKVDKHGRAAMDEAESIFDLYRSVVDGKVDNLDDIMNDARDRALLKQFAPDDQVTPTLSQATKTRLRQASDAGAYAAASALRKGWG